MSTPVFKIERKLLGPHIASFRVTNEQFKAIEELAHQSGYAKHEVIRKMIDFAIAHMPPPTKGL